METLDHALDLLRPRVGRGHGVQPKAIGKELWAFGPGRPPVSREIRPR